MNALRRRADRRRPTASALVTVLVAVGAAAVLVGPAPATTTVAPHWAYRWAVGQPGGRSVGSSGRVGGCPAGGPGRTGLDGSGQPTKCHDSSSAGTV